MTTLRALTLAVFCAAPCLAEGGSGISFSLSDPAVPRLTLPGGRTLAVAGFCLDGDNLHAVVEASERRPAPAARRWPKLLPIAAVPAASPAVVSVAAVARYVSWSDLASGKVSTIPACR